MNKVVRLVQGEMVRLYKNKILPISIFVSLIWVLLIVFSSAKETGGLLPMILVVDAGMLGIIYLAVSFYLEKQEGAIKSLFVAPVGANEILISKIIASIISSLISTTIIILTFFFAHHQKVNLLLLFVNTVLIVLAHSAIGFTIILNCRDFAQMLGIYAAYAILFFLPTVLYTLEIIPKTWETLLLISPTHSSLILLESPFRDVDFKLELLAFLYILILGLSLLVFYVKKKFKTNSVQG